MVQCWPCKYVDVTGNVSLTSCGHMFSAFVNIFICRLACKLWVVFSCAIIGVCRREYSYKTSVDWESRYFEMSVAVFTLTTQQARSWISFSLTAASQSVCDLWRCAVRPCHSGLRQWSLQATWRRWRRLNIDNIGRYVILLLVHDCAKWWMKWSPLLHTLGTDGTRLMSKPSMATPPVLMLLWMPHHSTATWYIYMCVCANWERWSLH